MEIEKVIKLIKSKKHTQNEIDLILQMDDETVLYFLDEFPLKKLSKSYPLKRKIFNRMIPIYTKNYITKLVNVETILEGLIILFPKKYFKLVGIQNINKFSELFQLTILDYCLRNVDKMLKKDTLEFIKINPNLINLYSETTKLMIHYKITKNVETFKKIINIIENHRSNTVLINRVHNFQKEAKVFTKNDFLQIKKAFNINS